MSRLNPLIWRKPLVLTAVTFALWWMATVPSGLGVLEMLVFAGPGFVLGLTVSWASAALSPAAWSWSRATRAAVTGGVMLPPIVAFAVAWSATVDYAMVMTVFIIGSWMALAAGLFVAAVRELRVERREEQRAHHREERHAS